jgi:hypothetical protein
MPSVSELSCFDGPERVLGLQSDQDVLYVGSNAVFPGLRKFVAGIYQARTRGEVNRLVIQGRTFPRVVIARENVLNRDFLEKVVQLVAPGGILCLFSDDEGLREAFEKWIEAGWPQASVWPAMSNVGPVVMTDANGYPQSKWPS